MFNKHNAHKNKCMCTGKFARNGYDWWWHSLTAVNEITKEEKQFFFEFFIINPKVSPQKATFGRQGQKPSYVMVKAGTWGKDHVQLHRFYNVKDVKIHYKFPFSLECEDCYLDDSYSKGKISISKKDCLLHPEWMCDYGELEWDLKIKKDIAFNVGYGTSWILRKIKAFEMYWHAEGIKTYYEGYIVFNGERYIVKRENSYGYADKNWGSNFTSPWVWLSSCNLVSNISNEKLENTAFDIGGGRPKIFFLALNKVLLGGFVYKGKEYEFNFSKFWTGSKTKFNCKILEDTVIWNVELSTRKARLVVEAKCNKDEMILVNYESPDGKKRHNNLYNGGNAIARVLLYEREGGTEKIVDDMLATHVGCEYGEYDK